MKTIKYKVITVLSAIFLFTACTDLEENILDEQLGQDLINNPANLQALINAPYASLRDMIEWFDYWGLQQITTDETVFPTRGSDWFDNGAWQQLYLHTWTPDHVRVFNVWNALSTAVSRANIAMYYIGNFSQDQTTEQYINEARFLRAYYMSLWIDLYGQVPFKEASDQDYTSTPNVMDRITATDFVISELNALVPSLQNKSVVGSERATRGAAQTLLAKMYLNYEVYAGETRWNEAAAMCDEVINAGEYTVTDDYWSMFQYTTSASHSEFILTAPMTDEVDLGSGSVWINFTLHYNQIFGNYTSFWNGGSTTADFYNRFDAVNDARYYDDRIKPTTGINQGFLIGQQYDINGVPLQDRSGNPLIFTPDFSLTASNERQGIRVVKFAPNPQTPNQFSSTNDVPLMRISDVYLMRAEARFRSGNVAGALEDINFIRSKRSAAGKTLPPLVTLTLDDILNERGYELYWEGYRRTDLIRFGRFTEARQEKPASGENKTLFPIPTSALDVNSNLVQNPQ